MISTAAFIDGNSALNGARSTPIFVRTVKSAYCLNVTNSRTGGFQLIPRALVALTRCGRSWRTVTSTTTNGTIVQLTDRWRPARRSQEMPRHRRRQCWMAGLLTGSRTVTAIAGRVCCLECGGRTPRVGTLRENGTL